MGCVTNSLTSATFVQALWLLDVKCGKPACRCAPAEAPGHGPYWLLTSEVNGKAQCRSIPAAALERTREQIAEYHRFRELVKTLIQINTKPGCRRPRRPERKAALLTRPRWKTCGESARDFEALERAVRRQALEMAAKCLRPQRRRSYPCLRLRRGGRLRGPSAKTFTTAERRWSGPTIIAGTARRAFSLATGRWGWKSIPSRPPSPAKVSFSSDEMAVDRTAPGGQTSLGGEVAECRVEAVEPSVSTLYLGMDGTGVPVRPSECEGRPGATAPPRPRQTGSRVAGPLESTIRRGVPTRPRLGLLTRRPSRCGDRRHRSRPVRPNGWTARRDAAASPRLSGAWCSATAPLDLEPLRTLPRGDRSSICSTRAAFGTPPKPSITDLAGQWARRRCGAKPAAAGSRLHKNHPEALRCIGYLKAHAIVPPAACPPPAWWNRGKRIVGDRKRGGHWSVDGANASSPGLLSGRFEDFWATAVQRSDLIRRAPGSSGKRRWLPG